MIEAVKAAIMGVCVGDALGVPVEFKTRDYLKQNPVTDMTGYGTYHQPPGTWSDDSSLTLCLAESLCHGFDLADIGHRFIMWYHKNHWTPHGEVFDAGHTTRAALRRLHTTNCAPQDAGPRDEQSNGNGALMRILPLAFYVRGLPLQDRIQTVSDVSSITHGHLRSIIACNAYISFALSLVEGRNLATAYQQMKQLIHQAYPDNPEIRFFHNLLELEIGALSERQVRSSGYVMHTLEASIWCLFNSNSFAECVLKAVNLGEDTDTTAAVAGGLAGIYYGYENIPEKWIVQIARKDDVLKLCQQLAERLPTSSD